MSPLPRLIHLRSLEKKTENTHKKMRKLADSADSTYYDFHFVFLCFFLVNDSACEEQFDYRDGENISSGSCSTVCD